MSWAVMCKINSNVKKPLNEQLRNQAFNTLKVITSTGTYKPTKTGLYRVICVGAGGNGVYKGTSSDDCVSSGGGGGVAIKDMVLYSTTSYNVTISTTASFNGTLTATAGLTAVYNGTTVETVPSGGSASGGDYNFKGEQGFSRTRTNEPVRGGSVQCVIPELNKSIMAADAMYNLLPYGSSLLGYGGGGPAVAGHLDGKYNSDYCLTGLPAAIIIIPLETEGY